MNPPDAPVPLRSVHTPVMVREVLQHLAVRSGMVVVDGTVGGGGHAAKLLDAVGPTGRLIGLDRDSTMLDRARSALPENNVALFHSSYADLQNVLASLNIATVDRILVDLGLSSDQLADQTRGFSFESPSPLDLRFNVQEGKPAWQRLSEWDVDTLQAVLLEFGEEPHSRKIAEAIIAERTPRPLTAQGLAELVARVAGRGGHGSRHPATRTFQGLRIAVNRELEHVEQALSTVFPACLKADGLLAVITFHSLEDRLVKDAFRDKGVWEAVTPKPVEPTPTEVRFNPRSRSAKLRVARRRAADTDDNRRGARR